MIVTVALFRRDPILSTLEFALVLPVAAIPVAMPTVLSVTMAVGARLLAKKQAIVTRLSAIEELAGVDILCSDKTGTLTQNKLTLGDPFTLNGIPGDQVILWAALASRAEDKDTIDLAVIGGVKDDKALKSYQVVHFQPFDPVHKRTEATVKGGDGKQFFVAKGAPQVILKMSTNAGDIKPAVDKAVNEFADAASVPWAWRGRMRKASGSSRACCRCSIRRASRPKQPSRAPVRWASASRWLPAIKWPSLRKRPSNWGWARTSWMPADWAIRSRRTRRSRRKPSKKRTVSPRYFRNISSTSWMSCSKRGHIVGMTGDGVNDAPALKKADCGIAVSGATDTARAAASIVLLASGLSVIIDAIKESRRILPAHEQLRDLPHRGNVARAVLHDAGDPGV